MIYKADTLYEIIKNNNVISGFHTFECLDEVYTVEVVVNPRDLIIEETIYLGEDVDDASMLVLIVKGNLIIKEGALLIPKTRRKGFLIYTSKVITNYGSISMSLRGAAAPGQNVYLYYSREGILQFVPKFGASGAPKYNAPSIGKYSDHVSKGYAGSVGVTRGTGGGGGGQCHGGWNSGAYGCGVGGQGTSYSGGAGSGGLASIDVGHKGIWTEGASLWIPSRARQDVSSSWIHSSYGGLGIPNGLCIIRRNYIYSWGTQANNNTQMGTGGLLIIFAFQLLNFGTIQANGATWTNYTGGSAGTHLGGCSGGGSINVKLRQKSILGTIIAAGGKSVAGCGAGGDGCVTIDEETSCYFLTKDNDKILI